MNNIEIINFDGELVVDSRLIAEEMGIQHRSLKDTIRTYLIDIEQLGRVTLTAAPSKASGGGGSGETFYYLNQDQANLLLTYGNNTEIIRQLKIKLIKAFKNARNNKLSNNTDDLLTKLINMVANQQNDINELKNKNLILEGVTKEKDELKKKVEIIETTANSHRGSMNVIEAEAEVINDMHYVTVNEFLKDNGIDIINTAKLRAIKLRAAEFYKASTRFKPPKKKGVSVYNGADLQYIREALFSLTGIILTNLVDSDDLALQ